MRYLSVFSVFVSLLFFAVQFYLRTLDEWGAWAASPILAVPIALSCVVFFAGIVHYVRFRRPWAVFWSVVGGMPAGWLIVRLFQIRR